MANREVHILSYFSLPTDLAATFSEWPEYRSGASYSVDLAAREVNRPGFRGGYFVYVTRPSGLN